MTVIDITSTNEILDFGEYIGYVCEPSAQSAIIRHKVETGQDADMVYKRVHSKQKFTTFYILKRKGSKK